MVVILTKAENIQKIVKKKKKKIKTKHYINFLLMEASLNSKNQFFPHCGSTKKNNLQISQE